MPEQIACFLSHLYTFPFLLYTYDMEGIVENETNSWATRRKNVYLAVVVLVLTSISFLIFWKFWYTTPTCFDGIKNGDESGTDCGGSCSLVCKSEVLNPILRWDPRLFEIVPGVWSALIYIENPNIDAEAVYVPYTFTIYDEHNDVLIVRQGSTVLPKNKTVGVFEGSIVVPEGKRPRRAIFDIGDKIIWNKSEVPEGKIEITHTPILRLQSAPRVEANVKNNGTRDLEKIELVIAIFDGQDNAVAASKTFLEKLKKGESANIFFTWPRPFELGSKICERPSNVVLLLDKSGSMAEISQNPPEPLNTAKEAAISFVKELGVNDTIGVISFATEAKKPIDMLLTDDLASAEKAINLVEIEKNGVQYTNIYDALHSAWQELATPRVKENSAKVIILLTDGVATYPKNPNGKTEADDTKYAESLALKEAIEIKKDNVTIYVIGLGDKINESFLRQVASEEENYFFAPTADDLKNIYKRISSSICQEIPVRIEITYKILDQNVADN